MDIRSLSGGRLCAGVHSANEFQSDLSPPRRLPERDSADALAIADFREPEGQSRLAQDLFLQQLLIRRTAAGCKRAFDVRQCGEDGFPVADGRSRSVLQRAFAPPLSELRRCTAGGWFASPLRRSAFQ